MCFTGTTLAFEKQITAWAERAERHVAPPEVDAVHIPIRELLKEVRRARPEARPASVVIPADPLTAVAFTFGREGTVYVNPYSGEIREPKSAGLHAFFQAMENWHRALALSGDNRSIGRAISGFCNCAFLVLATTGLYLWMPRTWSWQGVRAVAAFNFKLVGKARDFNWHNTIGVWCAPVLIVLTLTAVPMSYRWANDLIYRLTGSELPAQSGPGNPAAPAVEIAKPSPDAHPLGYEALLEGAQKEFPQWETITIRLGGSGRRAGGDGAPAREGTGKVQREGENRGGERRGGQPVALTVGSRGQWPFFANSTLTLDPYTGATLKRDDFTDQSAGRKIRTWARFLHTGEALGVGGQLVAALASLGGCFLAYTGLALAWRRFFSRRSSNAT
jgi:uncharacterized iron-regulated membrane protein